LTSLIDCSTVNYNRRQSDEILKVIRTNTAMNTQIIKDFVSEQFPEAILQ